MSAIPLIDLSPWTDSTDSNNKYSEQDRQAVVDQVAKACREIGFFAVQHHGVDGHVLDAAWTASREFFDLPAGAKLESKPDDQKVYPYGYEQCENLTLGKEQELVVGSTNSVSDCDCDDNKVAPAAADLKETFSIGPCNPDAGEQPRRFPAQPATFQPALENYYAAMEDLAGLLLKIFAMALDVPPTFFQAKMDHHMSALRVLNYFAVDSDANADANVENANANVAENADADADADADQARPPLIRAGAHTDYGALTILKSGGPGLQVKKDVGGSGNGSGDDADADADTWVDVPDLPNSYIINLGDLMQQWTNDKWVSTLHRVIIPNGSGGPPVSVSRRQSMAFFVNVNGDTVIEPLSTCVTAQQPAKSKYVVPVTARQHIMNKYLASMGIDPQ